MAGIKRHILVVDDNEYNREILVQNLEDLGFECDQAADGHEALQKVSHTIPALVLLDVMMPGIDGFEVCRRLRAERRTSELPIIMVTARADSNDVVAGLRDGANDYVTKPVDIDVLMARIETHLRLQELREESRRTSRRLMRELAAARAVQESLLPNRHKLQSLPDSYGLRLGALWRPCETLGGDFWDLVSLADGSLGIVLIDFPGSGVVPSLNTFRFKTFVQGQCSGLYNAGLTMSRINGELHRILSEFEIATCQYSRYDPDRRVMTVVSAGCPPPMVYRAASGAVERVPVSGAPAGAFAEASWEEVSVPLQIGDKIVFYTDGLLKHRSPERAFFSEVRLAELVAHRGNLEPAQLATILAEDIDSYTDESTSRDDTTVIFAEVVN